MRRGCTAAAAVIVVAVWAVLIVGGAGSLFAETPVKRGPGQVVEVVPDATVPDATGKIRKNIREVYVDGVLIERTYDQFWPNGEPVGRMRETRFKNGNPDQPLLMEYTDNAGKKYPHIMEYSDVTVSEGPGSGSDAVRQGTGAGSGSKGGVVGTTGAGTGTGQTPGGAVAGSPGFFNNDPTKPLEQANPDGSRTSFQYNSSGSVTSETTVDAGGKVIGTHLREYGEDGTTLAKLTVITPDGTVSVFDQVKGISSVTYPDGKNEVTFPDGTVSTKLSNGTIITKSPDGATETRSPDGTVKREPAAAAGGGAPGAAGATGVAGTISSGTVSSAGTEDKVVVPGAAGNFKGVSQDGGKTIDAVYTDTGSMTADTTAGIKTAGGAGAGEGSPATRTGVPGAGSGSRVVNVPDAKIPDATGKMRTNIKEVYVDGVLVEKSWDQTWPDGTPAGSMKQTGFNNGNPQEIYTDPEGNVMTHSGHSDAPVSVGTGAVQSSAASAAAPLSVKASKSPAPKGPRDALHGPKRTGEARAQRAAETKARRDGMRSTRGFGEFGTRGGFSGDRPGFGQAGGKNVLQSGGGQPLPSSGGGGGGQPQPQFDPNRMQQQN